jgi:hypothetical protein
MTSPYYRAAASVNLLALRLLCVALAPCFDLFAAPRQ